MLSFLDTPYFDDVLTAKPETPAPGFALVATAEQETVTGIIDVSVDDELATIDTVAVHPDYQHQGLGRTLLTEARARVSALGVRRWMPGRGTTPRRCAGIGRWASPRAGTTSMSTPTITLTPTNQTGPSANVGRG
ncbi:GNAT family N-acetyltransferase [Streptomyces sp. NBC_01221]|uniref:GNAT family N-acetyltransferase n=1 Tax=Streptomyces sp. NBC_01221 TaxID=2903782 RepID=UPI00225791BE|nr:GNAT family N-acetyltransferase [Streptomyces sp. NBC_01221]MCX4790320.1 GNAT family N-acetyltransferase [Streptomyces sp. NBC_01221]WSJ40908.1 GNAT family N-acetyltransferase [Streptomyces sp. NBC_01321]